MLQGADDRHPVRPDSVKQHNVYVDLFSPHSAAESSLKAKLIGSCFLLRILFKPRTTRVTVAAAGAIVLASDCVHLSRHQQPVSTTRTLLNTHRPSVAETGLKSHQNQSVRFSRLISLYRIRFCFNFQQFWPRKRQLIFA